MAEGAPASSGGLSPAAVGGKRSAWLKHVMAVKRAHPKFSLGDAMKEAKKTYKKTGGGGPMEGKVGPMGGKRTRKGKRGGALYGFGGDLADGGMAYGHSASADWKGDSALTGASAPAKGGRRTRRHRKSSKKAKGASRRR